MAKRRLAIIGLGMAVTPHARSLLDLQDRVEVVAAYSPSEARRIDFAARFPFPTIASLDAILGDPSIEVVAILTPPNTHLDLAHQGQVLSAMRWQADLGLAVVAILHDLNLAAAVADHLVLLAAGRVAAAGPPREVLRGEVLSAAYGCRVMPNRAPDQGRPFVLPPAAFLDALGPGSREDGP